MAYTRVLFRSQAREKILSGVNTLADAVRVTGGRGAAGERDEREQGQPPHSQLGVSPVSHAFRASRTSRAVVSTVALRARRPSGGFVQASAQLVRATGGRDGRRREAAMDEVTHDAVRGRPTGVGIQVVMRTQRERCE